MSVLLWAYTDHQMRCRQCVGLVQPVTAASMAASVVVLSMAASVVMEQVVAFEIACVLREKFGGDSLEEVQAQLACHDRLARQKLGLTD